MLRGIQISITLDIGFEVLADTLGISQEECIALWDDGELEEKVNGDMSIEEVLELCEDQDAYGGVNVGSAYS